MKIHKLFLVIAGVAAVAAHAGDPSQFFGVWADKHELGTVISEYKDNEVVLSTKDKNGVSAEPPSAFPVSYESLGKGDLGESFGVNLLDASGNKSGGFMVIVKDQNHILQVFPGLSGTLMERVP